MYSEQLIQEITKSGARVGYAVQIIFPDEIVTAHTGIGELEIEGFKYVGVGNLGSIAPIVSTPDANPTRINVELSGFPNTHLVTALKANARSSKCKIYILVFDEPTKKLKYYEVSLMGFVSDYNVSAGNDNKISITVSDEFERYEMPLHKYYTEESHLQDYPDDHFCRYSSQMADREIYWGAAKDAPPFNYGD